MVRHHHTPDLTCRRCGLSWKAHTVSFDEPPADAVAGDFGRGNWQGLWCPDTTARPVGAWLDVALANLDIQVADIKARAAAGQITPEVAEAALHSAAFVIDIITKPPDGRDRT